jgi:hypothetical protein
MQIRSLISFIGITFFITNFWAQQFYKPSTSEIILSPEWIKEMYSENPNVYKVDSLYHNYYASHTYVKSFHTQYYKRWRKSIADRINVDGSVKQYSQEELDVFYNAYNSQQSLNKSSNWSVVGPLHTTTGNGNQGSDQTNVYCIDQCESQPSVLYLGTEPGEVFKSVDGG